MYILSDDRIVISSIFSGVLEPFFLIMNKIMKYFLVLIMFFTAGILYSQSSQDQNPLKYLENASAIQGEKLFRANCAKCHELCDQQLGPALTDIMYKRPFSWLVSFIQNSSEVIASGDSYATHLYESYNNMEMPSFQDLGEKDVKNILAYLKRESDKGRRDTLIQNSVELSSLIEESRSRSYDEEQGSEDYFAIKSNLKIPVDEASALRGKTLFNKHCNSCHELCRSTIGPALSGISKRRPLPWLLSFINNPIEVVKTGDNYANYLISNFNIVMPQFSFITDKQKLDILAYIRYETASQVSTSGVNSQHIAEKSEGEQSSLDTSTLAYNESNQQNEDETKQFQNESAFEITSIIVLVLFFAFIGYFVVRYFRK